MALAVVTAVECMPGQVRPGHGLKLVVSFSGLADAGSIRDVELDMCGDVYAAMPPGTSTAANWMLPLKVRGKFLSDREVAPEPEQGGALRRRRIPINPQDGDSASGPYTRYTFVLGAVKLSHSTLRARLADLAAAGDPPFAMDLLCKYEGETRLFLRVATTASRMSQALDSQDHTLDLLDPVPAPLLAKANARRAPSPLRHALLFLRWWLLPMCFTVLCVCLFAVPAATSGVMGSLLPRIIRLHGPAAVRSIAEALPPVPDSLSQAFQLGELSAQYFASSPRNVTLLAKAAALLSRAEPLSEEQLSGVLSQVQQLEQRLGVVARVRGFFTFVNTMWLMAIFGIALSIGPSLMVILRPIRDWLRRCAEWVFRRIVQPFVRFLHDYGILEMGVWALCGGIVLEAQLHVTEEVALYIATTGMALACPALAYSTFRHACKLKGGDKMSLPRMVSTWLAMTTAPLAMAHNSNLLGYACVVAFYATLGFRVAAYGLCYCVGFENDNDMERCALTSFLLLCITGAARFLNNAFNLGGHLAPFRSAVSVFGGIVLFLALLIMSSRFYRHTSHGTSRRYITVNLITLTLLIGFMVLGFVGGLLGMANTATVFLVLWLVEKYADVHLESKWNGWILVLVLSVAAWRGALWLHSRPDFTASIFDF